MTRKDLKGVVILVFFAVTAAFLYNIVSPFGIALQGQWETSKGTVTALSKKDTVNSSIEITRPDQVFQMVQKKQRQILDVRPREIYDLGHLPHAISFPLVQFDEEIARILSTMDRQSAILVYCASFECTDSHTIAERLKHMGYTDVKVFSGGFRLWQDMGYEIEKNEE